MRTKQSFEKAVCQFLLALIFCVFDFAADANAKNTDGFGKPNRLCIALENIQAGDRLPVVFEGTLDVYYHFVDPREPLCRLNVTPATKVVFDDGVEIPEDLRALFETDQRALVVLAGELFGPELGSPPDPASHIVADYSKRYPKRYSGYWTKLVVHEIRQVQKVPSGLPWSLSGDESSPFPRLTKAEMPLVYPEMAAKLGLEGKVQVQLTIQQGEITQTKVISGDRILVEATLGHLKSWHFESESNAKFTTTFNYRIERNPPDATPIKIRAELPLRIEVATTFAIN